MGHDNVQQGGTKHNYKKNTQNNTNHPSKGAQEELSKFVHQLDISPHQLFSQWLSTHAQCN